MQLLVYDRATGAIQGTYSASAASLLAAQALPQDSATGTLLTETVASARELAERYVIADGAVVAKTEAALVADHPTFAADGVATCTVTLTPFVPCTLLVNQARVPLTSEDQTLVLTSDIPQTFTLALEPQAAVWAPGLTVEAT